MPCLPVAHGMQSYILPPPVLVYTRWTTVQQNSKIIQSQHALGLAGLRELIRRPAGRRRRRPSDHFIRVLIGWIVVCSNFDWLSKTLLARFRWEDKH